MSVIVDGFLETVTDFQWIAEEFPNDTTMKSSENTSKFLRISVLGRSLASLGVPRLLCKPSFAAGIRSVSFFGVPTEIPYANA